MFLIREVQKKDVADLLLLANTPGMFNLPSNRDAMLGRIANSQNSFAGTASNPKFVFVAEDLTSHHVVATSMIATQHGTAESPHYYFKVGTEHRFSETIQTGFIHGTLTLKSQTDGPSELGALVVADQYRNQPEKVGRQIFFSRFLYLLQNRNRFRDQLIAELLPPLNKKGHSPLWEAVGRRFTNLDYWEADSLSAKNKDFIHDLFPQGKIYTTFLSADARNSIGKVGISTEPVMHLLKRIGFTYQNEIDPFDGGPHLRALVSKVIPLQKACKVTLKKSKTLLKNPVTGLIAPVKHKDEFRALQVTGEIMNSKDGGLVLHLESNQSDLKKVQSLLKAGGNEPYDFLPYF